MCRAKPDDPVVAAYPVLSAIGSKYNKTAAQVSISILPVCLSVCLSVCVCLCVCVVTVIAQFILKLGFYCIV